MLRTHLHEFHCIIGRKMKKKLIILDLYKEMGSLSGIVVKILSLLTPFIKKEHKWGEQRMSRYMQVTDDPDEIREHMHVYFPGDVYREVKLMHADLNCFSIAQLVRSFLDFYLDLVKEYGDNVVQKLEGLLNQWNEEKEKNRLTPRQFIRQLQKLMRHLPGKNRLITIYNRQFSPFWVFRL